MAPALLLCLLATLSPSPGVALDMEGVNLKGGSGEYIEVGSGASYILSCDYRTAYDDAVLQVRWLKFGHPVYSWNLNGNPSVSDSLLGLVNASPETEPHSLHFVSIQYSLAGNYTCEVSTASNSVQDTYSLYVVDASSSPYETRVQVLSTINNSSGAIIENKYEVETGMAEDNIVFEDADCILVWSFSTPAIFPRPNVTCGYYSFDYDDVIRRLPAGLTMHKFPNGSWQASFDSTHVEVASIPRNHRLGCSVRIPGISYRKIIKADDDFLVDTYIDSAGCPSLNLDHTPDLAVEIQDATYTCRNNVLPNDRGGTAVARLSCPEGHAAVFPDGSIEVGWDMELSCQENDMGWRTFSSKDQPVLGKLIDLQELPYCKPGVFNIAIRGGADSFLISSTLLLLVIIFKL